MNRYAKTLILAAALALPLLSTGCVYVPARPAYRAVRVPAHWSGRRGDVWLSATGADWYPARGS